MLLSMASSSCYCLWVLVALQLSVLHGQLAYDNPFNEKPGPRPVERQPLKIIGAGLGRTGTETLHAALHVLGYKVYHNGINFGDKHGEVWLHAMKTGFTKGPVNMLASLGFNASLDDPANHFALDFLKIYPDAKVILTTKKSSGEWWKSATKLVDKIHALSHFPLTWMEKYYTFSNCMNHYWIEIRDCMDWNFHGLPYECVSHYESHNQKIRDNVPPSQLLDIQDLDSWEPLCKFLGVPVPVHDFPKVSEDDLMEMNSKKVMKTVYQVRARMVGHVLIGGVVFFYFIWPWARTKYALLRSRWSKSMASKDEGSAAFAENKME